MKKILIRIKGDVLLFKYSRIRDKNANDLMNTNVINDGELLFSDEYILNNRKIVANFIKELAADQNITKFEIQSVELAELIVTILSRVHVIDLLTILSEEAITFSIAEAIIESQNIKSVSCYMAPEFIIEYMDRNNIILESRGELFFTSNFMQSNSLEQYSKIYYKMNLRINNSMTEDDLNDFKAFCKINRYLKTIHFDQCNVEEIKAIIGILENAKKKNIKILIHNNVTNEKDIIALRKLNRQIKSKDKIKIKLVYSKDYIRDNYLKQVIFTTAKYVALMTLLVIGCCFSYISVNNHSSKKKVEDIQFTINKVLEEVKQEVPTEESEHGPTAIRELLNVNQDTVGWLTVNGTNIDYPVVQAVDNSYYLRHNFNNENDYSGWVFVDYRNNIDELNKNTIIYAHNRYNSDVMFGSLTKVLKKKWYENEDNLIITFNTLYDEMKFQVFSIYQIKKTNDYIATNFNSESEYLNFIEMIQGRSEVKFDKVISVSDKILTLSTCLENNQRLVVHAVLLTDE